MIQLNMPFVILLGYINIKTLTKKIGSRFTDEVVKVRVVQETTPHTYLLEDLNEEVIKGSFYLFELISVANKKLNISLL